VAIIITAFYVEFHYCVLSLSFIIAFYLFNEMLLFSLKQQKSGDALCLLYSGDLIAGVLYETKQNFFVAAASVICDAVSAPKPSKLSSIKFDVVNVW
jgi:hypothetical protein